MESSGLSPKMNTLNLLESLMQDDDKAGPLGGRDRSNRPSANLAHSDQNRHSLGRNPATSSFSEFKMGDIMSRGKVAATNPQAGFRGRKVRPGSAINPIAAAMNDGTQSRPFSADYSRRRRTQIGSDSRQVPVRAKSARWPRQPEGRVSTGHGHGLRRSSVNSSSVTSSDDEEFVYVDEGETDEDALSVSDFIGNTTAHNRSPRPGTSHGASSLGPDNKQSSRLLARKKQKKLQLFQNNPEKYYEDKLQQKYSELEVLRTGAVPDRRREVVQGHLQQMGLLHDQYHSASHGHLMSGPQSLPQGAGARQQRATDRPRSGRPARTGRAATSGRPRTGRRRAGRPVSGSRAAVREEAEREAVVETSTPRQRHNSLESNEPDHESQPLEEVETMVSSHRSEPTEQPLVAANLDNTQTKTTTESEDNSSFDMDGTNYDMMPTKLDHHIRNSENEYLIKWLKTKDRQYQRNLREEKNKKRAEREKLINEASEKLQKRLLSQQMYDAWRKSKNKEMLKKRREENAKLLAVKSQNSNQMAFPGNSVNIKPLHADQDNRENFKENEHTDTRVEEQTEPSSWVPPQTKFMYKRPVSGRIKMYYQVRNKSEDTREADRPSMQVRGKSPTRRSASQEPNEQEERQSFETIKRPSTGKATRKSSDRPVFSGRLSRSVNTSTRSKFGEGVERSRTVYLPEGAQASELTGLQYKRPSTAPPTRADPPRVKKADHSPQRVITTASSARADPPRAIRADHSPPRAITAAPSTRDSARTNSSSSELPFPPERGLPPHVSRRQKKLFTDADIYSETYQRELLSDVLIQEGVADIDAQIEKEQEKALTYQPSVEVDSNSEQSGSQNRLAVKETDNIAERSSRQELSGMVSETVYRSEEAKDHEERMAVERTEFEIKDTQKLKEIECDRDSSVFSSGESSESDDDGEVSCELKENINENDKEEAKEPEAVSTDTTSSQGELVEFADTASGKEKCIEEDLGTTQAFNFETMQIEQTNTQQLKGLNVERKEFNPDIELTIDTREASNKTKSESSSSTSSSLSSSDSEAEQKYEELDDKKSAEPEVLQTQGEAEILQQDTDTDANEQELQTDVQSTTIEATTKHQHLSSNVTNVRVKDVERSEATDDAISTDDDSSSENSDTPLKQSSPRDLVEARSEIRETLNKQTKEESSTSGLSPDNGEDIPLKDKVNALLANEENDSWYYVDSACEGQAPLTVDGDQFAVPESLDSHQLMENLDDSLQLLVKVSMLSKETDQTSVRKPQ